MSSQPGHEARRVVKKEAQMKIVTRLCISLDGVIALADGRPVQLADPAWDPDLYGFGEFQASCDAVLMGRTTFEPALGASRWPWPGLDVFVLGSHRPAGTPDHVVVENDPVRLLDRVRTINRGGDVHLIGGPLTIETIRAIGGLDKLGVIVLPILIGEGRRLTPPLSPKIGLTIERERTLPSGAVEIVYDVTS